MNKLLTVLAIMLLLVGIAVATTYTVSVFGNRTTNQYTERMTLISATTATTVAPGVGNTYVLPLPMSNFTCQRVFSSTTPSSATIKIEGSADGGTTWTLISSDTTTVASAWIAGSTYAVDQIRGNWSVLTGPSGTFVGTLKCYGRQY